MKQHQSEVEQGQRFKFGDNWMHFLEVLDDDRIAIAEKSLQQILDVESLEGKSFLDVGSGSGLFSLAARRLGADVHSFDYDPQSTACTRELKQRYYADDMRWVVEEGSILDKAYLAQLGQFDVVYSWGVLHHTGNMWQGLENIASLVCEGGGKLSIAIYNDEEIVSHFWLKVKKVFNSGLLGRSVMKVIFYPWFFTRSIVVSLVIYRHPFRRFTAYRKKRGMSVVHDWADWLGGYPFEVARPEKLLELYRSKGFELVGMKTTNRLGCNEFLYLKNCL